MPCVRNRRICGDLYVKIRLNYRHFSLDSAMTSRQHAPCCAFADVQLPRGNMLSERMIYAKRKAALHGQPWMSAIRPSAGEHMLCSAQPGHWQELPVKTWHSTQRWIQFWCWCFDVTDGYKCFEFVESYKHWELPLGVKKSTKRSRVLLKRFISCL